jgi:hypothetical protein
MPRIKAATLVLRIEPELKALAQRAAADDRRSLASLIEGLLSDYLCEKGYLRPTPREATANLTDEQHAALRMLAASVRGYSLSTLAARGFAPEMLDDLVRAGCATVHRIASGLGTSKIVSLRITVAGRKAIAE